MNKQQLVDAVGERLGDRKTAATAVEAVLDTVSGALAGGERVSLFGFGVFEKVDRAARTARNPSTGGTVQVPATAVPRFRAGQALKDAVNGRSSRATARQTSEGAEPTERRAVTRTARAAPEAEAAAKAEAPKAEAPSKSKAPKAEATSKSKAPKAKASPTKSKAPSKAKASPTKGKAPSKAKGKKGDAKGKSKSK